MSNATNTTNASLVAQSNATLLGLALFMGLCQAPVAAYAQAVEVPPLPPATEEPAPSDMPPVVPTHARSPGQVEDSERPPIHHAPVAEPTWYGWQTIIADVGSVGVMTLGAWGASTVDDGLTGPVFLLGVGGLVLTSPIIHLAHDNSWALGSLGLRFAGSALMIGGLGLILHCGFNDEVNCGEGSVAAAEIMAIAGFGLVVAMPVIDAVLAVDRPIRSRVAFTPWISPRADAAGVALVGQL